MLNNIRIDKIVINENDRPQITDDSVKELLASIKVVGILQAPVVRPIGKPKNESYELVAGFRRHHCQVLLGKNTMYCNVQELSDTEARIVRLTENLQRKDLHPLDESKAYQELTELGNTAKQIALKIGKPENYVVQMLKLKSLSKQVQKEFRNGGLELGHAKVLMILPAAEQNKSVDYIKQHFGDFSYFSTPYDLLSYINRSIKRSLTDAIFDTERKKGFGSAGACSGCPFNSSTAPGLFGMIEGDSVCTKPSCYDNKVAITKEERKADLLKKHNVTEKKVQKVTTSYGTYGNELGTKDYREAKPSDKDVTLAKKQVWTGKGYEDQFLEIVITKQEDDSKQAKEEQVVFEKPHEEFKGRLERRRLKQLHTDTHTARAGMVETMAEDKRDVLTDWEFRQMFIDYVVRKESDYTIIKQLELKNEKGKEAKYYEIPRLIHQMDIPTLSRSIRKFMAYNHINSSEKEIASLAMERDVFKQHAQDLGVKYEDLVQTEHLKRKEVHDQEDSKLKHMIEHAEKKDQKALDHIAEAPEEDPVLVKIMKAKKPATVIKKQDTEYLTKLSRKLGSKTKKGADAEWYARVLPIRIAELKDLQSQIESIPEESAAEVNSTEVDTADIIDLGNAEAQSDEVPAIAEEVSESVTETVPIPVG